MDYRFEQNDKTVEAALRRISTALLHEAISLADETHSPGQLHAIRKNIKMTRGLLRLVAPHFAGFKAENGALRDAARLIAQHRDAEVMAQVVTDLAAVGAQVATPEIAALATQNAASLRADLDALASALQAIAARCKGWRLDAAGFDALDDGLRTTWAACRKDLKRLRHAADDAGLHRWRGHIKAHWYHARLLQPIWPEMMAPHIAAADALGELLGEHHDLAVLRTRLAQGHPSTATNRALDKRCARRQARTEADIFAVAERFLAEPAKPLAARWRRWWQIWRC